MGRTIPQTTKNPMALMLAPPGARNTPLPLLALVRVLNILLPLPALVRGALTTHTCEPLLNAVCLIICIYAPLPTVAAIPR